MYRSPRLCFPSLSDEEVVAPPALEDVPATIESVESPTQEIPPSQYAQPAVAQPQVAYDTGPTGTFVGGKINQFRADLSSIQNAVSSHNNDFLRFKDLVDEQTLFIRVFQALFVLDYKLGQLLETLFSWTME